MLRIDLKPGESVRIGNMATLTLEEKSGKVARLAFDADKSIDIRRVEAGNVTASMAASGGISSFPGRPVPA